jgi:alcohol dehydrogenase YqhD (iron-dependent ADH family)
MAAQKSTAADHARRFNDIFSFGGFGGILITDSHFKEKEHFEMIDFSFLCPTEMIFGKGAQMKAGAETKKYGNKVLLHYGSGHIKKSGLYDQVTASLKQAGVDFLELGGVMPNPRLSLVREGIRLCRDSGVDFILAVGGGSVIDSAKAIALGAANDGDVWDFFTGKREAERALPLGVVLTIPAAGSESSAGSVVTNEETADKRHYDTQLVRPKFALMNPELTYTLPAYQTACGAADIMAHIMERYFTRVAHVDLTDRLCEATLKTVIRNVPLALAEPEGYAARAEIMWAGSIAHNDILGTGRIGDWSSHMIEHELSGINDVAHGAGLAIVFPAWMRYVYKQDISRFVQFAARVWNVETDHFDLEKTALAGIDAIKAYFRSIGLPVSLTEIGITPAHYERIATNCRRTSGDAVGNFMPLRTADIVEILKIAQ